MPSDNFLLECYILAYFGIKLASDIFRYPVAILETDKTRLCTM